MRMIPKIFLIGWYAILLSACAVVATNMNDVKVSYDPLKENWQHLSFDPKNFACEAFDELCTNFLDQIDCAPHARSNFACSPDIYHYNGTCICHGDPVYQDKGARISKQMVDNRIKGEIGWMLEPWSAGPPFSVKASYPPICELLLTRLGCPSDQQSIVVGSDDGTVPFKCACGKFTGSSVRVEELICDKINEANLAEMPVFADPVTLSIQLSLAIVLIVGKLGAILASFIYLPPIIGFLLAGVAIQDVVSQSLIKGAGGNGPHATPFGEMRVFALIIVLMRAGMTIKPHEIAKQGVLTVTMSVIPYFAEFAVMMGVGMKVLGWSAVDTGLLASILAALSPSLVIPGMIKMVNDRLGYAPKAVLSSAPIEVVLAIILFNVFSNLELTSPNPLLPWVKVLPLWANIILIPVNILFSSVLGYICGYLVSQYIDYRNSMIGNKTVDRVLGNTTAEFLFVTIVICYLLYSLCTPQYIQQTNGVLAVFTMTLAMSHYGDPLVMTNLKDALAGLWVFLEVILFTTTGVNLAFKGTTGPLQSERGINGTIVDELCEILFLGTMGRAAGILVVQLISFPTLKPHRKEPKYLAAWWLATWMFQWPKATVQATLGGLPLAMHIIPGADGLSKGLLIQQASAFSVLLMATIGVFLTSIVGLPLAKYLADLDEKAGFDENDKAIGDIDKNSEEAAADAKPVDDDKGALDDVESGGDVKAGLEMTNLDSGSYAVVATNDETEPNSPTPLLGASHTKPDAEVPSVAPKQVDIDEDYTGRARAESRGRSASQARRRRSSAGSRIGDVEDDTEDAPRVFQPRRRRSSAGSHVGEADDYIETPQGLYQRVLPPSTLPYDWT